MINFDCLKGLIGFTKDNDCLGTAPLSMQLDSLSNLYMDKHPSFIAWIVNEQTGFWREDGWEIIANADQDTRNQLGLDLIRGIRSKVEPTMQTLRVELGEDRGGGYHRDFNQPAVMTIPTNNVADAVFYVTHIGIRAMILTSQKTATVVLKKNGTITDGWQVPFTSNSNTRIPLPVPKALELDGSVYTFQWVFDSETFPSKNPMDCGCELVRAGYNCFFPPFEGDGGGIRLLGELRCMESIWPCMAATHGTAGLSAAKAYRAYLVAQLLIGLKTNRKARVNAYTLLKDEDVQPVIDSLMSEYQSNMIDFTNFWSPSGSCCYKAKTRTIVASGL